jgi:hypothetical protein
MNSMLSKGYRGVCGIPVDGALGVGYVMCRCFSFLQYNLHSTSASYKLHPHRSAIS